uniref:Uncharacterized protein n=1 Tax=Ananas comosus var. bracteatus TaxID=296719 RepID=A0A6V7PGE9_ANACO|nr:unnamed protein product [Ananas comosus var. bracteatus]
MASLYYFRAQGCCFADFQRRPSAFRLSLIELDRDTLHTRLGSSHECHSGDGRCAFALVSFMPVRLALHGLDKPSSSAVAVADQDRGKGVATEPEPTPAEVVAPASPISKAAAEEAKPAEGDGTRIAGTEGGNEKNEAHRGGDTRINGTEGGNGTRIAGTKGDGRRSEARQVETQT